MAWSIPFAQVRAFDPETTVAMAAAFEAAWEELKDCGHVLAAAFKAHATREMLAKGILDAAQRGVRDPNLLRHEALLVVAHPRRMVDPQVRH